VPTNENHPTMYLSNRKADKHFADRSVQVVFASQLIFVIYVIFEVRVSEQRLQVGEMEQNS
jgi:hypothetical protein